MSELLPLTVTDFLAGATRCLEEAGYKRIEKLNIPELSNSGTRVFEDVYNIVAVTAFNTWSELQENWTRAEEIHGSQLHVVGAWGTVHFGHFVSNDPNFLLRSASLPDVLFQVSESFDIKNRANNRIKEMIKKYRFIN